MGIKSVPTIKDSSSISVVDSQVKGLQRKVADIVTQIKNAKGQEKQKLQSKLEYTLRLKRMAERKLDYLSGLTKEQLDYNFVSLNDEIEYGNSRNTSIPKKYMDAYDNTDR